MINNVQALLSVFENGFKLITLAEQNVPFKNVLWAYIRYNCAQRSALQNI